MVLGAISSLLLIQMISYTAQSRKQITISKDLARYSSLMDSIIDFTSYGVKNRWCFDTTWSHDTSAACTLGSEFSSEAMLLTRDSYKSLVDYARLNNEAIPAVYSSGVIRANVDVATWATGHPLSRALNGLLQATNGAIRTIEISIRRVQEEDYPIRGDEALIRIEVVLHPTAAAGRFFGSFDRLTSSALFLITPRELNYFTVVVPKDLRLDGVAGLGNLSIPLNEKGNGVVFESPVYVEGDVHLPPKGSKSYTTFASKVYAFGKLYRDGALFAPETPGGTGDQYFSELNTFGGFARGIDFESQGDPGLGYFIGTTAGGTNSSAINLMQQCRSISYAEMNLAQTRKSDLIFRPITSTAITGTGAASQATLGFRIGLSGANRFTPQEYGVRKNIPPGFTGTGEPGISTTAGANRAIINADVRVNASFTARNGTVTTQAREYHYAMSFSSAMNSTHQLGFQNTIMISTQPVQTTTGVQDLNLVDFFVTLNGANLPRINSITIHVQGMDLAVFGGQDRRLTLSGGTASLSYNPANLEDPNNLGDPRHSRALDVGFTFNSSTNTFDMGGNTIPGTNSAGVTYFKSSGVPQVSVESSTSNVAGFSSPDAIQGPYPDDLYGGSSFTQFRANCNGNPQVGRQTVSGSFTPGKWSPEYAFAPDTRNSWNFTGSPSAPFPNSSRFWVASIANKCTVGNTQSFLAGFLVCDEFTIQSRTTPFLFIGTIIAKNFSIDPAAVKAGVRFMSIYHPAATFLLRQNGILRNFNDQACTNTAPTVPIWHPEASLSAFYDNYHCNATSLRNLSDPFTWTTMAPDCATPNGAATPVCVHRPHKFLMRELVRKGDLQ